MGKFEEYLDRAKDLAEDAGDIMKDLAGEVVSKAKDLTEEGGKVRELAQSAKEQAQNAKEQAAAISLGARDKVQGLMKDARAAKELQAGISELQALPEFEGSILYTMELNTMISDLNSLVLFIGDGRLDDASVIEEVNKVVEKIKPAEAQVEDAPQIDVPQMSDEEAAIAKAKAIAYGACTRALAVLNA